MGLNNSLYLCALIDPAPCSAKDLRCRVANSGLFRGGISFIQLSFYVICELGVFLNAHALQTNSTACLKGRCNQMCIHNMAPHYAKLRVYNRAAKFCVSTAYAEFCVIA